MDNPGAVAKRARTSGRGGDGPRRAARAGHPVVVPAVEVDDLRLARVEVVEAVAELGEAASDGRVTVPWKVMHPHISDGPVPHVGPELSARTRSAPGDKRFRPGAVAAL